MDDFFNVLGGADDLGAFSYDNSSYELDYKTDPTMDMYQIGRSLTGNDFIVTGMLHVDESGCTAGPLSRFACRIYCERLPPFRSFIFAGAFDTDKVRNLHSKSKLFLQIPLTSLNESTYRH